MNKITILYYDKIQNENVLDSHHLAGFPSYTGFLSFLPTVYNKLNRNSIDLKMHFFFYGYIKLISFIDRLR